LTQLKIIEDTRFTLKKIHSEWKKLIGKFKRFKKNIFKEEDYYYIETRIADLRSGLNKLFKKIRFDGIFDNRNIYSFNEWSKDLYESLLNYKKEFKSKSEEIKNILEDRDYLSKQINIDLVKSFKEKYYNLLINLIQHLNEIKKLIEDNEQKFNRQDKKLSKINIALKSPEYLESNYLAHDKKLMIHNRLLNIVNSSKLYVLKLFSLIDNTILNLIKNIDIFKFGVNDLQALVDENKEREKIIKQIQDDLSSDNEFTFFLDEIDRKLNNPVEADKEFIEAANEVLRKEIISDNQPYGSVEDLEVSLLELEKELIKHQDERLNQIQQLNIFRNEQAAE
jgi:hypothetical protein